MSTIPARQLVSVTPGVLAAGGNALDLIGLVLTKNTRVPIGVVSAFADTTDVDNFFGATSDEATAADVYFKGFDNSNVKPGSILFTQYPATEVAAYLRGGSVSGMTLAQLQALSGSLAVVMDGYANIITSINLSGYNSFSAAAAAIEAAFTSPVQANITGSIAGTTLTVTVTDAIAIAAGQQVSGTGVAADTFILTQLSGSIGGTGTYQVNNSQTSLSAPMTTAAAGPEVTYDSVAGAFVITSAITGTPSTAAFATGTLAASLNLTSANGAVLSQGAAATDPETFMDALVQVTTDWATFMTLFDPDASGNANKLLFAKWVNDTLDQFAYVAWDTDSSPTTVVPATSSLGYLLQQGNYSGTCPIYSPDYKFAAFVCGAAASIDFTETNGRVTFAYKGQTGLVPNVTNATAADNLAGDPQSGNKANGYNFYGAYATANQKFNLFQRGTVSGPWDWLDSYLNQIWLNAQFELAILLLMSRIKSIPYNQAGYSLIQAACADVIVAGLNFGAFRAGVTLSQSQIAQVNSAAGVNIDKVLSAQGWYLQVKDASPQVRQQRGSPPCTFWYCDGESVQAIQLASINVQ